MYDRILVPVDGSGASLRSLNEAIRLAKVTGATLRLLHIVNEFGGGYPTPGALYFREVIDGMVEDGKKVLSDCERIAREQGVSPETELVETIGGHAADVILNHASQWPADLIVMGTHGRRGIRRLALGSDAEMVLRQASVPVLVLRNLKDAA